MKKIADIGVIYFFLMIIFLINTYMSETDIEDILLTSLIMFASLRIVRRIGKKDG